MRACSSGLPLSRAFFVVRFVVSPTGFVCCLFGCFELHFEKQELAPRPLWPFLRLVVLHKHGVKATPKRLHGSDARTVSTELLSPTAGASLFVRVGVRGLRPSTLVSVRWEVLLPEFSPGTNNFSFRTTFSKNLRKTGEKRNKQVKQKTGYWVKKVQKVFFSAAPHKHKLGSPSGDGSTSGGLDLPFELSRG